MLTQQKSQFLSYHSLEQVFNYLQAKFEVIRLKCYKVTFFESESGKGTYSSNPL